MLAVTVQAETIEVKVDGVKFAPSIIHAAVGDVIAFRHMPTHFVETVEGMWPEGAPKMLSVMGMPYEYRIERSGIYVYKCPPHWSARMGGVIVAGPPKDTDADLDRYFLVADSVKEAKPAKTLLYRLRSGQGVPESQR